MAHNPVYGKGRGISGSRASVSSRASQASEGRKTSEDSSRASRLEYVYWRKTPIANISQKTSIAAILLRMTRASHTTSIN
jgi:hypothetical protein